MFTQMVPVVAADQNVYHCHNTAYAKHGLIGSLKHRTFQNLWFSDDAKKAFAKLNPQASCKHQCAAHGKNEMINSLLQASGDNFV
jgi:radical SAM protein with 4Fe4S-binding SPASM domain